MESVHPVRDIRTIEAVALRNLCSVAGADFEDQASVVFHSLEPTPQAPSPEQMCELIVQTVFEDVVPRILTSSSPEATLIEVWPSYVSLSEAYKTNFRVLRQNSRAMLGRASVITFLLDSARFLRGEEGYYDAEFAQDTIDRARGLLPQLGSRATLNEADRALAVEYKVGLKLFELGSLCAVAAHRDRSGTPEGIAFAFQLLRWGSLNAYSSVRQAIDLREALKPTDDSDSFVLLDEEDHRLLRLG